MLRDPLAVKKKFLLTTCGQKYLQNPKNLEPLDHIFVCVKVCVCVCDCESECVEERRCGVVTLKSPKKNTSFKKTTYLSVALSIAKQTLYLTKNTKTEFISMYFV